MDCFRLEIKENLDDLKATISSIEKSLEQAWEYIEDHTAELKAHKDVRLSKKGNWRAEIWTAENIATC